MGFEHAVAVRTDPRHEAVAVGQAAGGFARFGPLRRERLIKLTGLQARLAAAVNQVAFVQMSHGNVPPSLYSRLPRSRVREKQLSRTGPARFRTRYRCEPLIVREK